MKALVLEDYNKLVYKDVPDPEIKPDEVLVRVKACGICGSDVHGLDGSTGRRIPPLIMGHEASGIIDQTGSSVTGWNIGDRVTFDSTVYNLDDWYTLRGKYNLSDNRQVLGVSTGEYKRNGAFAELVAIPQHILYRIPDTVTFEQAAMVEAAAVALHSINISGIKPGDVCVVIGTGMIGIFIIKLLVLSGAGKIIAVDNDPSRLKVAKMCGAEYGFDPMEFDFDDKLKNLTAGRGADISYEAVGKSESINTAIRSVRKGGTVLLIGNISKIVDFPLQKIVTGEITVQGSCAICGDYELILKFLESKKLIVDDMISVVAPLVDGAHWFTKLYNREDGLNKVLLVP
jgi:threonine dehydrogenase-like Zn-dependent dehydrogenase